jgi:hypothetical protein
MWFTHSHEVCLKKTRNEKRCGFELRVQMSSDEDGMSKQFVIWNLKIFG